MKIENETMVHHFTLISLSIINCFHLHEAPMIHYISAIDNNFVTSGPFITTVIICSIMIDDFVISALEYILHYYRNVNF